MTTGASLLIGASSADPSWDAIDWQTAERSVRRLQMRIAKATQLRRRVRSLALERLERCEGKLSRTVLRGGSDRKVAPLPGNSRRACRRLSVARSALSHESVLAKRDAPVVEEMQALARQYPRHGYRRIQVSLVRQWFVMSADRAYRLVARGGASGPPASP